MSERLVHRLLSTVGAAAVVAATIVLPAQAAHAVGPDLLVVGISEPPAAAAVGTSFTVTDTTTNSGDTTAGASTTRYYLSVDQFRNSGDRLLVGGRPVPTLDPTASNTGSRSVKIPNNAALGNFYLLACSDDLLVVAEGNEANNCLSSSTRVQVTATAAADLVVTGISEPPSSVVLGNSFSVTDTTANVGSAIARASTTRYYLSADQFRNSGDRLLVGGRPVPALAGGVANTGSRSVKVPTNVALGNYYVLACSDDLLVVSESNETNNCLSSSTRVQVTTARPNLYADASFPFSSSVPAGSAFTAYSHAHNVGEAAAPASQLRWYISDDTVFDTGDRRLTGILEVPSLSASSGFFEGQRSVTVPRNVASGTYNLLSCADDTGLVVESDETDNCLWGGSTLTVTPGLDAPTPRV